MKERVLKTLHEDEDDRRELGGVGGGGEGAKRGPTDDKKKRCKSLGHELVVRNRARVCVELTTHLRHRKDLLDALNQV